MQELTCCVDKKECNVYEQDQTILCERGPAADSRHCHNMQQTKVGFGLSDSPDPVGRLPSRTGRSN